MATASVAPGPPPGTTQQYSPALNAPGGAPGSSAIPVGSPENTVDPARGGVFDGFTLALLALALLLVISRRR